VRDKSAPTGGFNQHKIWLKESGSLFAEYKEMYMLSQEKEQI